MLQKLPTIRGCSFLFQLIKRNEPEKSSQNNGARRGARRTPVVLTRRRALFAAYINSQQILKQVQDDCKGWCMRLGPIARNGLCVTDHGIRRVMQEPPFSLVRLVNW
jgi:hypothetical protein